MKKKMSSSAKIGSMLVPEDSGKADIVDGVDGGDKIRLNVSDYPDLTGIEAGASVSGTWEGTVDDAQDEDGNVFVTPSSMEIELENAADKELSELSNRPGQIFRPTGGGNEDDDEI